MLKNYIDLSGLEYFRDSLLVDDIASRASDTVHAPSVKSVLDYINSLKVNEIIEPYGDGLVTEAAVGNYVDPQFDLVSESINSIEESLEGKQAKITGAASSITDTNLTIGRVLVSNGSGKVSTSTTSDTELSYLKGVTSSVQTQLNGKAKTVHGVHLTDVKTGTANCQILRRPKVGVLNDDDVSEYEWVGLSTILMDDPEGLGMPILNMALNADLYVKGSIATYKGDDSDIVKMMKAVKQEVFNSENTPGSDPSQGTDPT